VIVFLNLLASLFFCEDAACMDREAFYGASAEEELTDNRILSSFTQLWLLPHFTILNYSQELLLNG